jgi:CheY-like chemotaxis protein
VNKSNFEYSISILVIDSDEGSRRLLADTLIALGYEILQAASVAEAWEYFGRHKIDLAMADIFMPEADGIHFLHRLKKERPEIPVIILSSLTDKASLDELLGAGADGVLTKPFRINRVEELISTVLLKFDKASISASKSKRKILVVDDDFSLLDYMIEATKTLGYEVEAKTNAADAIQAFSLTPFDLVVSDYMLPDSSGFDLMCGVRKIRTDTPFVIVTGYPVAYPPSLAKADGVDGYLVKPFRINQLEQVISGIFYPEKTEKNINR